jgi:hypothetical protein
MKFYKKRVVIWANSASAADEAWEAVRWDVAETDDIISAEDFPPEEVDSADPEAPKREKD